MESLMYFVSSFREYPRTSQGLFRVDTLSCYHRRRLLSVFSDVDRDVGKGRKTGLSPRTSGGVFRFGSEPTTILTFCPYLLRPGVHRRGSGPATTVLTFCPYLPRPGVHHRGPGPGLGSWGPQGPWTGHVQSDDTSRFGADVLQMRD